jgi:hypothetical protein
MYLIIFLTSRLDTYLIQLLSDSFKSLDHGFDLLMNVVHLVLENVHFIIHILTFFRVEIILIGRVDEMAVGLSVLQMRQIVVFSLLVHSLDLLTRVVFGHEELACEDM